MTEDLRDEWFGRLQGLLEECIEEAPDETCRIFAKNLWDQTAEFDEDEDSDTAILLTGYHLKWFLENRPLGKTELSTMEPAWRILCKVPAGRGWEFCEDANPPGWRKTAEEPRDG